MSSRGHTSVSFGSSSSSPQLLRAQSLTLYSKLLQLLGLKMTPTCYYLQMWISSSFPSERHLCTSNCLINISTKVSNTILNLSCPKTELLTFAPQSYSFRVSHISFLESLSFYMLRPKSSRSCIRKIMSFLPSTYNENRTTSSHLHSDHTVHGHHHLSPGPTNQLLGLPASFPMHPPMPTPALAPCWSLFSKQHPERSSLASHTMSLLCSKPSRVSSSH